LLGSRHGADGCRARRGRRVEWRDRLVRRPERPRRLLRSGRPRGTRRPLRRSVVARSSRRERWMVVDKNLLRSGSSICYDALASNHSQEPRAMATIPAPATELLAAALVCELTVAHLTV